MKPRRTPKMTDRERYDELVRRLAPEQMEGILAPLFAGYLDLARQQGRLSALIEGSYSLFDNYRAELTELAAKLGLDDPHAGEPPPSAEGPDRVATTIRASTIAAVEELRLCRNR